MKIIAMFLPQFHADPFNNAWWGDGFTEWVNVKKAKPLFAGHRQPRTPLNGYFDLAQESELQAQAELAAQHGISGFGLYDYWYEGKRPLGRPLEILSKTKNFPVTINLCWANHSWTRSWTNRSGALDVLVEQTYAQTEEGRSEHYRHFLSAFETPHYMRVKGKPFLQVYQPERLPPGYMQGLRHYVQKATGQDIHLDALITTWLPQWSHLHDYDSATLFQPSASLFSPRNMFDTTRNQIVTVEQRVRALPPSMRKWIYLLRDLLPNRHTLHDHSEVWKNLVAQYATSAPSAPRSLNPMAFVDFDNTPRYAKRARIMTDYQLDTFKQGLRQLLATTRNIGQSELLFINAWNEWGEGAYLQPDTHEGFARLNAIRSATTIS